MVFSISVDHILCFFRYARIRESFLTIFVRNMVSAPVWIHPVYSSGCLDSEKVCSHSLQEYGFYPSVDPVM